MSDTEPRRIETWMMPQYVKRYFGGSLQCIKSFREENGSQVPVYTFIGENRKEWVCYGQRNSKEARDTICEIVAEKIETDDKRIRK